MHDTLTLSPDDRRKLEAIAARTGRPAAEVLHEAVSRLPMPPKPGADESAYDALMRSGVVGSADFGADDVGEHADRYLDQNGFGRD